MSVHSSRCQTNVQDKYRAALGPCKPAQACVPVDMTRIPVCDPPEPNPMNIYCGCPQMARQEYCSKMPYVIEARIMKRPVRCIKQPCNYCIPAMPCNDPPKTPYEPKRDPLCFEWAVDEVGPNDSYGLNGLNWYDWGKMRELNQQLNSSSTKTFTHPGLSNDTILTSTREYVCCLPLMCYSRSPGYVPSESFASDVNYFRDWKACEANDKSPWKPPYAQWATNQHM